MQPILFADNPQFWFEVQRVLGHTAYGGADTGEVLATAQRIESGDYDSWHDEWLVTAERVARVAEHAAMGGHRVSARDGYLRASSYYRSAEFFLHGYAEDFRADYSYEQSVACFRAAASLFIPAVQPVSVPFEGTTLQGYFYTGGDGRPGPTILMHNGFHGSAEELHFFGAAAAAERGYNVLAFDGPGQPAARHRDGLVFRPEWEDVVSPVLDWLLARADVDTDRVSLLGVSMGGYLAARAAAFDDRIAACIAVDGIYDLGEISTRWLPLPRSEAEAMLRAEPAPEADAAVETLMAADPRVRWAIAHGSWAFGSTSPRAFVAAYLDYSLAGGIAEQIRCPTLVCAAEEDIFLSGQPEAVYEHLTCSKTLMRFTSSEGAGAHCHSGAQRLAFARIFDWLDDTSAGR